VTGRRPLPGLRRGEGWVGGRARRIALVALAVSLPALANAPADQYSFFARDDTHIQDNFTHLDWDRGASGPDTQANAATACGGAGKRLPTVKELLTLVDENVHEEFDPGTKTIVTKAIDPNAFPQTPAVEFWTSTLGTNAGKFRTVDFESGVTSQRSTGLLAYRCVKDF